MKQSIRQYLFKMKWPVAIGVFVLFTGFVGENCWIRRIEQKSEIAKLRGDIEEYNRKFEADKKVLNRMRTDPDASAEVAREKYLMKKAEEDIYIFDEDEKK